MVEKKQDQTAKGSSSSAETSGDGNVVIESASTAKPKDLARMVKELQHKALIDRDTIVGLEAQLSVLTAQLADIAETDNAIAIARIDNLAEERMSLLETIHRMSKTQLQVIDDMRATTTWRIGSVVVKPLTKIKAARRKS